MGLNQIAHFAASDHDSFGDMLFPKLAERYLPNCALTFVSPYALKTPFSDATETIPIAEAMVRDDFDAVMLGGGNLLGFMRWAPRGWREHERIPGTATLEMWLAPHCLADRLGVPMLWNATGSHGFDVPAGIRREIDALLAGVTYASVRDQPTADEVMPHLRVEPRVVPDSALLVSRLWPAELIHVRRTLICITREEFTNCPGDIRQAFESLRARGREIFHLSLINHLWAYRPEELEESLTAVGIKSLDCPCSLHGWAEEIGRSDGFLGNSLHGLIVAVSYGRRAVLVLARDRGNMPKYRGFLDACGLPADQFIATSWTEAVEKYFSQTAKVPAAAFDAVLENFRRLESVVATVGVRPGPGTGIRLEDVLEKFGSSFLRRARVKYKWSLQANGPNHPLTRRYRFASRPLTSWLYRLLGGTL